MSKTFSDFGIVIPSGRSGEVDVTCPQCSAQRKKKHARCLSVNVDKGVWTCMHCGWAGGLNEPERRLDAGWRKPQYRRPAAPAAKPLDPVAEWFASRGIPRAVVERNRIAATTVYMPQVEDHVGAVAFPYYRGDELVNVKYRDRSKNFRMEAGAERVLYGLNDIEPELCVIVEGEVDKLSVEVAGITSCISVPDGAPTPTAKDYASKFSFLEADAERIQAVKRWVIAVDADEPGQRLEDELARRLGREKCTRVRWPNDCKDANDVLRSFGAELLRECIENAEPFPIEGLFTMEDASAKVSRLFVHGWEKALSTGWDELDQFYRVRPGELTVVTGVPGSGKALALDTPIPTPDGWTTMGDLREGSKLYDESGNVCRVVHAFEVMYGRPCYRLTLSDGSEFIADADHLWVTRTDKARRSAIQTRNKRGQRQETAPRGTDQRWMKTYPSAVTTEEIRRTLFAASDGRRNHAIKVSAPICGERLDLPIEPYTLGAWLGDGSSACGAICAAEPEIISQITADGFSVTRMPSTKWGYTIRGLQPKLRRLGLLDNKHVPKIYLRASIEQRKAILAGLMDTDGHMGSDGRCEFCNMNEVLARDVFELVASLGLKPTIKQGRATLYGKDCGTKFRVFFTPSFSPFRLPRKSARIKSVGCERLTGHRMVVSVEPVVSVPVRCIAVDSPTKQFLIGHAFVPTHNSNMMDALAVNIAKDSGWRFMLFSPENQPVEDHVARMIEKLTVQPFFDGPTPRMDEATMRDGMKWVMDHFSWYLPGEEKEWTVSNILSVARQLVYRQGIRGLIIDPWNELECARSRDQTETEYIGASLRSIRQFARQHGVHVWIVAHPQKMERKKDGGYPIPTMYDIAGSAHWRNKADNGLCVWRDFEQENAPVELYIQKIRFRQNGKLGCAKFEYRRATATYHELPYFDRRAG